MFVVFYRRDDGTIRHFHNTGMMPREYLRQKIVEYNRIAKGETAHFVEYETGSFEEHLFKVAKERTKLDVQNLRDIRASLDEVDGLLRNLIAEAERAERGKA